MKMIIFCFLILFISISTSGIYELFKEKQKQKEFEDSLKNIFDYIHIKNAVKCIENNFEDKEDKKFIKKIRNYSIGNYYAQKSLLLTKFKRYKKCIKENISYYPNGKFKREFYY